MQHRSDRAASICPIIRPRALLSAVEQAARRRGQSDLEGRVPAVPQPAQLRAGAAGAVGRPGSVVDAVASQPPDSRGPEASGRHACSAVAAVATWVSRISRASRIPVSRRPATGSTTARTSMQTCIPTINPPVITPPYEDNPANGPIYPSYVPKTDSDGNDIAGIRLPELTVPLATYTGWALRSRRLGERRLRKFGPVHSVLGNQGGAPSGGRSASIGRGALSLVRAIPRKSGPRRRRYGETPVLDLR